MIVLCADTSFKGISFTLASVDTDETKEILTKKYDTVGRVSDTFFEDTDLFFSKTDFRPADVDLWVVVTGPGSFTGLRVSISALSGIARGYNKPLKGISALDAKALLVKEKQFTVAAKLRPEIYACKDYNFENLIFSEIYLTPFKQDYILVNSENDYNSILSQSVIKPYFKKFISSATPVYARKSEAELQLINKKKSV